MAASARASLVFVVVVLAVASVAALATTATATATACDPRQLLPCAPAIAGNAAAPSPACCARLSAHPGSCFCRYIDEEEPEFQAYVNNPNAGKVFAACDVLPPSCGDGMSSS
ncbi:hypothetical protein ACP4OV_021200 [Aristida adscensionis]